MTFLSYSCVSFGWPVIGPGMCTFFFFQAEDGIRDPLATGVQTCALPISCALGDFGCGSCAAHLPLNPFTVVDADGSLRGNLLRKKTIGGRSWHAPRRSVRLVEETAVLDRKNVV